MRLTKSGEFLKVSYVADGILGPLRSEGEEPEEEASHYHHCHGQRIISSRTCGAFSSCVFAVAGEPPC